MKPNWDRLMAEYKDHESILVADVDCTSSAGKAKCQEVKVRGYPTIKYGDPENLQDYKGGRTYQELSEWAGNLRPSCGPRNMQLCDEEKQKLIKELQALSQEERNALIKEKEETIEKLEANFTALSKEMFKNHKDLEEQKDAAVRAAKSKGLALLKSVHFLEGKKVKKEL
uniref:Thioredoxin domain-containing protein n=1 Tax=Alexandrium monilatum TaxID=311494 RepID=A0A7S4UQ15_9DINO|mmetsp:Transcript_89433/g.266766  ORF Transcript_89433/g.266766 Transcript_89433/m.266766 type:complete len:170 (+) Transcript_89433:55-564(+)